MTTETERSPLDASGPGPAGIPVQAAPPAASDPVVELRAELARLRRQQEVNDEEIDLLQVEAARHHRKWHQDPTVLTAAVAVVISLASTLLGQYNLSSDREVQARSRLTALVQQVPQVQEKVAKDGASTEGLLLIAGDAAELMEEVESSSFEKLSVAQGLLSAGEIGRAAELVEQAAAQATGLLEKVYANRFLAQVRFLTGDREGGRSAYRQALELLQQPAARSDSPLVRAFTAAYTELLWAQAEFGAGDCLAARDHLGNADRGFAALGTPLVGDLQAAAERTRTAIFQKCP